MTNAVQWLRTPHLNNCKYFFGAAKFYEDRDLAEQAVTQQHASVQQEELIMIGTTNDTHARSLFGRLASG